MHYLVRRHFSVPFLTFSISALREKFYFADVGRHEMCAYFRLSFHYLLPPLISINYIIDTPTFHH